MHAYDMDSSRVTVIVSDDDVEVEKAAAAAAAAAAARSSITMPSPLQGGRKGDGDEKKVRVAVEGPIIVGAGPSGLAVAASLRVLSVPFVVVERSEGLAELWRTRTYDRLSLHLPKRFCHLPHLPFPRHFPTYPSKSYFLHYLHSYASRFRLAPHFRRAVTHARFDRAVSLWRVTALERRGAADPSPSPSPSSSSNSTSEEKEYVEYVAPWVVVATGENAEAVVPETKGRELFTGRVVHSSEYRSGEEYSGGKVLVVGCGNSGMEICLDLCEHGAMPFMSVRSGVHLLPRDMFGTSTFGLVTKLLQWLPIKLVDRILLLAAKMVLGDTEKYGLKRPNLGPLETKHITGKTPVLDVGTLALIKAGKIQIVREVESLTSNGARFVDGSEKRFDAVIFATGYKSNVPLWLQDCDFFTADGKPKSPFPNGWKGENGLYCVGFTGRGLHGAGQDAVKVAQDIAQKWTNLSHNNNNNNNNAVT
ncbi:putative indole-3-pyruvate monooxygenase YUCCA4 [Ananas comosus]|uniref:Flavin-containing monooxygenase n=1 Tax=Ananas comosus TaxID=4615 RepID=A0A199VV30_ANACO|nr:putative indole-3-pyruvate monooxygenase YUCCA4 [Ananas comosus]